MANRIPTFIDAANERISELLSGDALDITGGTVLADGIETDTLTVNGVLYVPYDDTAIGLRVDSEHAWNVAEHTSLQGEITDEVTARSDADTALGLRVDSEHAWNLSEHAVVNGRIDTEEQTRLLADIALGTAIDSEHAWNVAEHVTLQSNITAEALARSNADSDLNVALDAEITTRANADTALGLRVDSEHAWNVTEHAALQASIDSIDLSSYVSIDPEIRDGRYNFYGANQGFNWQNSSGKYRVIIGNSTAVPGVGLNSAFFIAGDTPDTNKSWEYSINEYAVVELNGMRLYGKNGATIENFDTVQATDFLDADGNSIILTTFDAGSGGDDF